MVPQRMSSKTQRQSKNKAHTGTPNQLMGNPVTCRVTTATTAAIIKAERTEAHSQRRPGFTIRDTGMTSQLVPNQARRAIGSKMDRR